MTNSGKKWLIAAGAILLQFFIFKQFYPFASFFADSYTYIYAAVHRDIISFRPTGYSWFLFLIHGISASDTFLVFVQYCLLQLAGLYLYFSVERLYRPRKTTGNILFFFLLLNPATLYVANLVSSDALFTALTLIWMTGLLWLMHRPTWGRLALQALLLILICNIRYNALFYPVVTAAAYVMTRRSLVFKLTGILSGVLALWLYTLVVGQVNWQRTGVRTFSAFSGWQMANNALYAYPYIKVDPARLPTPACRELDSVVKGYFDTADISRRGLRPVDFMYMWDNHTPLKKYMLLRQKQERTSYFTAWNRVAPVYSDYGSYILFHHPVIFAREFGLHSAYSYLVPYLYELQRYNNGEREVDAIAKEWFHYSSVRVKAFSGTAQAYILSPFQVLWVILHVAVIFAGLLFLRPGSGKYRAAGAGLRKGLLLTAVYIVTNAAFSIFANVSLFRYQLGPMIWLFTFVLVSFDYLFSGWKPAPAIRKE